MILSKKMGEHLVVAKILSEKFNLGKCPPSISNYELREKVGCNVNEIKL